MSVSPLHDWDLAPRAAVALQRELAGRLQTAPLPAWKTLAAVDVSFDRGSPWLFAAVVVVEAETLRVIEQAGVRSAARFPYVSGLLSFRELPAVLEAWDRLTVEPDVILCDGQGIAHPRRLGIAAHLGLWLDRPTIGSAKSRLCGQGDDPGPNPGDRTPLIDRGEVVGTILRTRARAGPLYVSPGHRCDLAGAVDVVLATGRGYRIPEPIRLAHDFVNRLRREAKAEPSA